MDPRRIQNLKQFKSFTAQMMPLTSGLSFFTMFIWILGLPGTKNDYARGWSLGWMTLLVYFLGSLLALILYKIVEFGSRRIKQLSQISWLIIGAFWIFFTYSVFNLYRAFKIMGVLP